MFFSHPFSKAYWKQALQEVRSTRMLVFAALMIALRVALKSVSIPIAADLRIGVGFFANALGSMVYGPVLAMLSAIVTDTLGALLFPSGPYFPLFIITEVAGSLVFALFLYRARLTSLRVMLSRFCIDFFVNIVLQTPIMMAYYQIMLGKSYAVFNGPRIIKNLILFPIESVLLILFLKIALPALSSQGLIQNDTSQLTFSRKNMLILAALALGGAAAVGLYVLMK